MTRNFLQQLLSRIAQNVKVWCKKHAIKLFQYSFIPFYLHNKELSDELLRLNIVRDQNIPLSLQRDYAFDFSSDLAGKKLFVSQIRTE